MDKDLIRKALIDGLAYTMKNYAYYLSIGQANSVLRAQQAIERIEAAIAELDNSRERQEGGTE